MNPKYPYVLEFWAGTDLRFEARIDASNDIEAFVIAQSTHCDALDWCKHSPTFKLALKRLSNFPVDNKLNI